MNPNEKFAFYGNIEHSCWDRVEEIINPDGRFPDGIYDIEETTLSHTWSILHFVMDIPPLRAGLL